MRSVAFSPDGSAHRLGQSTTDTLRIWDAESGAELQRLTGHEGFVTSVAFSPDGRRIVSGSRDRTLRIWDAETGAELQRLTGHKRLRCIASRSAPMVSASSRAVDDRHPADLGRGERGGTAAPDGA